MKILGISGSLRKGSFNTGLIKAAGSFLSPANNFDVFDLSDIPLYNGDIDGEQKPDAVQAFLNAVNAADAVLIATPEYNYSIPGVLKNALDWASRPAYNSVLKGKPTGLLASSMSTIGGARALIHLREVLSATLTPVYLHPDFALASAHKAFDPSGNLVDEKSLEYLEKYIEGFVPWVEKQA